MMDDDDDDNDDGDDDDDDDDNKYKLWSWYDGIKNPFCGYF